MRSVISCLVFLVILACAGLSPAAAQSAPMLLASPYFGNNETMPLSTINNYIVNGANLCTVTGAAGGDQSPPLVWANVPPATRSFALVAFDATASFTHWAIYDIPGRVRELPENAGAANSSQYGIQVYSDGGVQGYFGPCPPPNVAPDTHRYVFTLYALDKKLNPPGSVNFPSTGESLYQALLAASAGGHVLATATLTGLYNNTPR